MGEYDYEEYDDDNGADNSPRALRDALKAAQKELKSTKAELAKQAEEVSKFLTQSRSATISDLLKSKGVNPKASGLIPSTVEATEEAVNAWLEQYGDVLNITSSDTASGQEAAAAATLQEEDDPATKSLRDAWAVVQAATQGAASSDINRTAGDAIEKIGVNAQSFDEAVKALNALPGISVGNYQA